MKRTSFDVVGIPLGTRLQQLVLFGDEVHVWIAVKKRDADYSKWQGTCLVCSPDGSVTRVTHDDAYTVDDVFVIKPPREKDVNDGA